MILVSGHTPYGDEMGALWNKEKYLSMKIKSMMNFFNA